MLVIKPAERLSILKYNEAITVFEEYGPDLPIGQISIKAKSHYYCNCESYSINTAHFHNVQQNTHTSTN